KSSSFLQPDSVVAAGGVIRNSREKVLHTFAENLGRCTITRVELRGAIVGLMLAWDHGYRKVNLQPESQCAVSGLVGDSPNDFLHLSCITVARQLFDRN
ncbi:hypothetical protein LINGRAHAP2_LOCUS11934, partial [Linum grandiflorum]